ncbi:ABC transporter permease [Nocardia gipuzkoensis]
MTAPELLNEPLITPPAARRGVPGLRLFAMTAGLQRATLILGLGLVGVFVVAAVFAPFIAPYGFAQSAADGVDFARQQAPSAEHWFGTSVRGEDVFSRVIYGARTALWVIAISLVLSLLIGVPLGLLSGYLGRWPDRLLVLFMDAMYAFPTLLLAIVVSIVVAGGRSTSLGGVLSAAVAITAVFVPQYFRVVRNATVAVKQEPYDRDRHRLRAEGDHRRRADHGAGRHRAGRDPHPAAGPARSHRQRDRADHPQHGRGRRYRRPRGGDAGRRGGRAGAGGRAVRAALRGLHPCTAGRGAASGHRAARARPVRQCPHRGRSGAGGP